jgi:hypothetical protein
MHLHCILGRNARLFAALSDILAEAAHLFFSAYGSAACIPTAEAEGLSSWFDKMSMAEIF